MSSLVCFGLFSWFNPYVMKVKSFFFIRTAMVPADVKSLKSHLGLLNSESYYCVTIIIIIKISLW